MTTLEREMQDAVDLMEGIVDEYGYRPECPNHADKELTYEGFAQAADNIEDTFFAVVGGTL